MKTEEKQKLIAEEIKKVSKSIRRFRDGPLSDRCVVVLLHDSTGLPMGTIKDVLAGIEGLEDYYLNADRDWETF